MGMSWMKFLKRGVAVAALGVLAVSVAPASAQTVNDIVSKGKVSIGVLTGAPPYDRVDGNGRTIGYHVDLAHMIGKALDVEVEIVPVTAVSRMTALETGRIDIQIAQMTPTPESARVVMFTAPYGSYQISVIGKKGDAIAKVEDMAGKSVSVAKGSVQDMTLTGMNIANLSIVRFEDDAIAMQALVSGKVDMTLSRAVMAVDFLKQEGLGEKFDVKFPLSMQYFSMAVRKDAFELHQWLNNFLFYVKTTGQLEAAHVKWTTVPIPGGWLPTF